MFKSINYDGRRNEAGCSYQSLAFPRDDEEFGSAKLFTENKIEWESEDVNEFSLTELTNPSKS